PQRIERELAEVDRLDPRRAPHADRDRLRPLRQPPDGRPRDRPLRHRGRGVDHPDRRPAATLQRAVRRAPQRVDRGHSPGDMTAVAAGQLEYQVFTARRPGLGPADVPPGYESLMWVANSATLISGKRDAVLVDTFFTIEHSTRLADEVAATGKKLTFIYVTHAHGDHFFGINLLKRRFPAVRAVAAASVVERIGKRL